MASLGRVKLMTGIAWLSDVYVPFPYIDVFYVPFYVKKTKMDYFMCLLEFEW